MPKVIIVADHGKVTGSVFALHNHTIHGPTPIITIIIRNFNVTVNSKQ